ncbi:hypothetical protein WN51_12094 [Melipona quadrifasciata]|uniref:XK-related protein n=1 Tax=Melipona quadrifasciata TaxID=166423 RepID=A0A0M9A5K6_9HYME|nr:hypothetical protein WN51_12094 [Melipona quadrifasciata]
MANDLDSVCKKKSTRFMQIPLKSTIQIYLIFLIPTLITCFVYIIHFSADLVVAIQHFKEYNLVWGCCTIGFMYAPAIAYFMLTVSRPDWWMSNDDKLTKSIFYWFSHQLCQLVVFVFFSLYRYAGLIVLSIEAIILNGRERTETLNIASAPAAIELYFFMVSGIVVKVLSIIMSVVILAIQTTSFQRFESQRINGRKLPWAMWLKKYCVQELHDFEEREPLKLSNIKKSNNVEDSREQKESIKIQHEDTEQSDSHVTLHRQVSVTPPLPPKNVYITPPPTPLRGITTVTPLPIPDAPAPPRPDSICTIPENSESEKLFTKAISIADTKKSINTTQNLKVPQRRYSTKGLEEDDPVGKFLSFLWWFFFILARILTIATFYEFYPLYLSIVLGIHYGLIYIVSLIEYRIKFKYADKWIGMDFGIPIYFMLFLEL